MTQVQEVESQPSTQIHEIWYTRCPVPTATGIALDLNWLASEFSPDGIALHSLQQSQDKNVRSSHFYHHLKSMFREGGNIPAIWARSRGQNTAVIGLTWIDEAQVLLARPESGINGLHDLKGKRFGLPKRPGEAIDFWRAMALRGYLASLEIAGLERHDIRFVDLPAPENDFQWNPNTREASRDVLLDRLLNDEADVIYIKGSTAIALAEKHGLQVVFDINSHPDPRFHINNGTPRPITVDRQLIEERFDLVARYLAVLLATSNWAREHKQEVLRVVASETSTNEASVEAAYGSDLHRSLEVKLTDSLIGALADQKDFLLANDFLPANFEVREWIDPAPLEEAHRLVRSGKVSVGLQVGKAG